MTPRRLRRPELRWSCFPRPPNRCCAGGAASSSRSSLLSQERWHRQTLIPSLLNTHQIHKTKSLTISNSRFRFSLSKPVFLYRYVSVSVRLSYSHFSCFRLRFTWLALETSNKIQIQWSDFKVSALLKNKKKIVYKITTPEPEIHQF
jgi:hypothetical protein